MFCKKNVDVLASDDKRMKWSTYFNSFPYPGVAPAKIVGKRYGTFYSASEKNSDDNDDVIDDQIDQNTKRVGSMIPMARIGKRDGNYAANFANSADSGADYYDYNILPMPRIGRRGGPGSGMIPMARIGKRSGNGNTYHIPMPRIG